MDILFRKHLGGKKKTPETLPKGGNSNPATALESLIFFAVGKPSFRGE